MSAQERQYHYLRAELAELNKLLTETPETAVIDRMSLEYRKSQVEEELEDHPAPPRWPATAHLAFNGKPVVDRRGVYADFAGTAVDAFAKAVTSLAASQQTTLGERGVIPNREQYRLLVTGTSHGSFGFEIEEASEPQATYLADESLVELAIEQAKGILESLVAGEEALAEAIADADGRALDDLRDFLEVMADNEAVCSLSFKNASFGFRDVGQVRRGVVSLGRDNLREGEAELRGHFQGFLPQSRRAEFVVGQSGEVISCRVDHAVDDPEGINGILGHNVNVRTRFRQVGNSRPRYTVMGYAPISEALN